MLSSGNSCSEVLYNMGLVVYVTMSGEQCCQNYKAGLGGFGVPVMFSAGMFSHAATKNVGLEGGQESELTCTRDLGRKSERQGA